MCNIGMCLANFSKGGNVLGPAIARNAPEVDFDSLRSQAKSASEKSGIFILFFMKIASKTHLRRRLAGFDKQNNR
jgi:hypothetical protein